MTQFSPTLLVRRLIVMRNEHIVYNEEFHLGVNILRGDNSSGKSTILNMLYFGLGGELKDWSDTALLCTSVIVEASFNGMIATLSREISDTVGRPMLIFPGSYEEAVKAPIGSWTRYPYKRSDSLESFSEVMFRLLGIPEVKSDNTGNLTIHQILRLLYADQLSPVEQIFRFEPFDPPALRDTVGRLLCGAYNGEVYNNQVKLKELGRRYDSVSSELKSLFAVLGRTDQAHTLDWINSEKVVLTQKLAANHAETELAERKLFSSEVSDEITLLAQKNAYDEVQKLQLRISQEQAKIDSLTFEIADSDSFINGLHRKIRTLQESENVARELGSIHFLSCPSCYSAVEATEEDHICALCKSDLNGGPTHQRIISLVNETGRQLKQSQMLQQNRVETLKSLQEKISELKDEWTTASRRLTNLQQLPSGELQARLRQLAKESGYIEREIDDLSAKEAIAKEIETLSKNKESLNEAIGKLKARNDILIAGQAKRLDQAYIAIEKEVVKLLRGDLTRQDAFVSAKHVEFDFGANSLSVDGQTYFSASSRVVLKTAFFVGFLWAATKDREFRHPRFCIIDTIEDKGMEQIRSHNFQKMIVQASEHCEVDHQIIFATAMIAPELDLPEYTVGSHSSLQMATLNLGRSNF